MDNHELAEKYKTLTNLDDLQIPYYRVSKIGSTNQSWSCQNWDRLSHTEQMKIGYYNFSLASRDDLDKEFEIQEPFSCQQKGKVAYFSLSDEH